MMKMYKPPKHKEDEFYKMFERKNCTGRYVVKLLDDYYNHNIDQEYKKYIRYFIKSNGLNFNEITFLAMDF